eukprot:Sspe_Gene.67938::Locus_40070_Transcript_1_2_Confidence_0.667_Length_2054::g.67938::m.67938
MALRSTSVMLRKYTVQEFMFKKSYQHEGRTVSSVVSRPHVFQLPMDEVHAMSNQSSPEKPVRITLIPIFDYAFPSFWQGVQEYVIQAQTHSVFCEGYTGDYIRKKHIPLRASRSLYGVKSRLLPWQRWRQQRQPWPWAIPHPVKLHGGDLMNYNSFQRLFPRLRPSPDLSSDEARVEHCMKRMNTLVHQYQSPCAAVLWDYRFMPLFAEKIEEAGYNLFNTRELEAGSELNELYAWTFVWLQRQAEKTFHQQ